jgi:hypothetical protein
MYASVFDSWETFPAIFCYEKTVKYCANFLFCVKYGLYEER